MISISSAAFDPSGVLLLPEVLPASALRGASRRVTKTATLDGGVSVSDTGSTDADRDLVVIVPDATLAQIERASRLVSIYPLVSVSTGEGAFEGIPERYSVSGNQLSLTISLTRRISEFGVSP